MPKLTPTTLDVKTCSDCPWGRFDVSDEDFCGLDTAARRIASAEPPPWCPLRLHPVTVGLPMDLLHQADTPLGWALALKLSGTFNTTEPRTPQNHNPVTLPALPFGTPTAIKPPSMHRHRAMMNRGALDAPLSDEGNRRELIQHATDPWERSRDAPPWPGGMTVNKLMDAVLDTSDMSDDECKAELAASGVDVQAASRRFDERLAALAKRGKV